MTDAKRVLMIAHGWPPAGGVGVMRTVMFAKYLTQMGWSPTVLVPHVASPQVTCDEEEGIFRGVRVFRAGSVKRGGYSRWYGAAVDKAKELFRYEEFEIVYSSSPPEVTHYIGRMLKQEYARLHPGSQIRWVADMRDPWADYHQERQLPPVRWCVRTRERQIMKDADRIVTVSGHFAEHMKRLYGRGDVEVIPNGFDVDSLTKEEAAAGRRGERFVLRYAGKLHAKYQDPEPLFIAIRELVKEGKVERSRISVEFYTFGQYLPDLKGLAKRYGLDDIVKVRDPVPYRECLRLLERASAFILVDWAGDDTISKGVIPAKVFDYLGIGRPIIVVSARGDSDVSLLLRVYERADLCADTHALKDAIEKRYKRFFESGPELVAGIGEERMRFSRKIRAGVLATIFDGLLSGTAAACRGLQ